MIDFNGGGFFARLGKVKDDEFDDLISPIIISGEFVVGAYKSIRDGVVFTNKRIITINIQGLTGKKKDFTSIPYSKITTFSVETAGFFDLDAELEIYMSAVGKVKFEFKGSSDIKEICQKMSEYIL
ncbi:MAG: PH domain-containing protein [Clostridia bacterium]|nr:PH domain-containing protein [Clostridia bacterium]